MSGIEIAGLALAVLPILMTAVQQYNSCLTPIKRFRRFSTEAQDHYEELMIQRTIFRNHCRNLLEEVVDHDAASAMLNSLTQKSWSDQSIDEQLASKLGESLEACIAVVRLIGQRLQVTIEESRGFKSIVDQEKKVLVCSCSLSSTLLTNQRREGDSQKHQR